MARSISFVLTSLAAVAAQAQTIPPGGLDDAGLKTMLAGLGYEIKEPGVGTFEIVQQNAGLNIPTRVFLTKSKTKVWLSTALMQKDAVDKLSQADLRKILETNVEVGPCHFMIEGGWLKLKMAVDNRALTPALLRYELDYLGARVADTKVLWMPSATKPQTATIP